MSSEPESINSVNCFAVHEPIHVERSCLSVPSACTTSLPSFAFVIRLHVFSNFFDLTKIVQPTATCPRIVSSVFTALQSIFHRPTSLCVFLTEFGNLRKHFLSGCIVPLFINKLFSATPTPVGFCCRFPSSKPSGSSIGLVYSRD